MHGAQTSYIQREREREGRGKGVRETERKRERERQNSECQSAANRCIRDGAWELWFGPVSHVWLLFPFPPCVFLSFFIPSVASLPQSIHHSPQHRCSRSVSSTGPALFILTTLFLHWPPVPPPCGPKSPVLPTNKTIAIHHFTRVEKFCQKCRF